MEHFFFMLDLLHDRNNSLSHRHIDRSAKLFPTVTRSTCRSKSSLNPSVFLKKTYYYSCLSVCPSSYAQVHLRTVTPACGTCCLLSDISVGGSVVMCVCALVIWGYLLASRLNTRCSRLWDLKVWALAENTKCENTRRQQQRHAHD